jgi:serine/threonine protein phosphatase PrpC
MASDGIFEFLTDEVVMKIVIPFYLKNDPEGACEKLVKEAVYMWKQEDEVVDDITAIVLFFKN